MNIATTKAAAAAIKRHYSMTSGSFNGRSQYDGQYLKQTTSGPRWTYCSGYSIITSPDPLPGLEQLPDLGQLDPVEFMENHLYSFKPTSRREYHAAPETVTRAAVDAWRKNKENNGLAYAIQDRGQEIGVNARYLSDLMTIYPKALLYVAGPLDPIILSDAGPLEPVALVMPVRLDANRAGHARRTA